MYCVKCKRRTNTNNIERAISRNNRNMLRGMCEECGNTKTQFVKEEVGRGLSNKLINNLPFELHLHKGNPARKTHNFTGPGTQLWRRLDKNDNPKAWSLPVNKVDAVSLKHDLCYRDHSDTKTRNSLCDQNMLESLKNITNPTVGEKFDRALVTPIIGAKKRFGWGLKKTSGGRMN